MEIFSIRSIQLGKGLEMIEILVINECPSYKPSVLIF